MEEGLARMEIGTPVTETSFPTVAHLVNTGSTFKPRLKDLLSYESFTNPLLPTPELTHPSEVPTAPNGHLCAPTLLNTLLTCFQVFYLL